MTRRCAEEGLQILRDAGLDVSVWEEDRPIPRDVLLKEAPKCDGKSDTLFYYFRLFFLMMFRSFLLRSSINACRCCMFPNTLSALLCMLTEKIDGQLLDACPQLKIVSDHSVGYDNIDVPACTQRGIRVGNTPGVRN